MTSGVSSASARSRSWFSATAPPTSAPAGSAARSRSTVAPTAVVGRVRRRDRLDQRRLAAARAAAGSDRGRCPGRLRQRSRDRAASACGRDDLQRARRARAERLLDLLVALRASRPPPGTTLIDGMPVSRPRTGRASATSDDDGDDAVRPAGAATAARPRRAKRGERCSPECTHWQREPVDARRRACASTAGSSVSVAARTKTTDEHDPEAIERNAGLGTSITARQRDQHGQAAEQHRLAGGVHRHRGGLRPAPSFEPKNAPRKR